MRLPCCISCVHASYAIRVPDILIMSENTHHSTAKGRLISDNCWEKFIFSHYRMNNTTLETRHEISHLLCAARCTPGIDSGIMLLMIFFIGLFVGMYIIGRFKELTTWIISYSDEMYGMRILLEREEVSYAFSLN